MRTSASTQGSGSTGPPGFDDAVERDLGYPGPLGRVCQEFFRWLGFLQGSNDESGGSQGTEIPGQRTVVGMRVDHLTVYTLPGQIGNGNLAIMAYFSPDGGVGIDIFDLPARSIDYIETGMGEARYKASLWYEHTGDLLDSFSGILNIHECHVANDEVECTIFQHVQVSCVSYMIGDTQWLLCLSCSISLNERCIGINCYDDSSLS